jgi:excisionase family DNA binding protein
VPTKHPKPEELVEDVLRLRRAARIADDPARSEILAVSAHLEESVGPTVSRAAAARLLGVSYTSLDRWIEKGDISALFTPGGRREIPLSELLDLLEDVEQRRADGARFALASVIRDRRRQASAIDENEFLPPQLQRRTKPRRHRTAELQALAYHRLVARRLDQPLVDEAKRRLKRWREQGRIHPRWADEWERILAMPLPRIAKTIRADSQRARELRQSSPFAGVLTEQERRRLVETVEERALT